MYSTAFWCLFVVLLFFWLYCVTTVTPFIERSEGWSLRSVGVLDQSQQECRFFRRNSNPLQIFQLRPKRETSSSSLGDRLEKRSIISPSNRAICAGLRGKSGFRPVPVITVATEFRRKNGILVATGPGPCQIEVTSLHFVL